MRNILNLSSDLSVIMDFEWALTLRWTKIAIQACSIVDEEKRAIIYQIFEIESDNDAALDFEGCSAIAFAQIEDIKFKELKGEKLNIWTDKKIEKGLQEKLDQLKKAGIDYTIDEISVLGESGYENLRKIKELKSKLKSIVYDQDQAIEAIGDSLVKSFYKPDPKHPEGILLFLGPPATGKTLLAEEIASHLRGSGKFLRIDMSRFSHEQEKSALFGSERFWNGTAPGLLTSFVRENPTAVIVLDEFEKSHSRIQTRFLSILNDAYCDDACGWYKDGKPYSRERAADEEYADQDVYERVDFSRVILIFTSNLGSEVYTDPTFIQLLNKSPGESEKIMFDTLTREMKIEDSHKVPAIRPEFLSRLRQGRLVLFNALSYDTLMKIGEKNLLIEAEKFSKAYVCKTEYNDIEKVVQALLLSAAPSFDVRGINAHSANLIFDPITDYLMGNENVVKKITIGVSEDVKNNLESIITEDKNQFKREIFRKNLTFNIGVTIETEGSHLKVIIDSIRSKQIKRAADYKDGGIAAELPDVTFEHIAGHTKTKDRLKEITKLLKSYKHLQRLNIPIPKGMLMYGPTGTGKTMLAKAFASESGLPFISTTGKNLLDEAHMKKVFETARLYAPAVIFIDEIDALRKRGSSGYNDSYYDQRTNQMLTYIDGFDSSYADPIFIIAATNNPDMVDDAILRSGRIDLHIEIGSLDKEARKYFIDRMMRRSLFDKNINHEKIILLTAGMSGADLEKLERECSLEAIRHGVDKISEAALIEQINIVFYGEKSPAKRRDDYLEETAYHEAGHAVVSKMLIPEKIIQQITIVPRENANGFVSYSIEDIQQLKMTKGRIEAEMAIALAGRAAQIIKFGEDNIDGGASSDLESANSYAHYAIAKLGMDTELFNISMMFNSIDYSSVYRDDLSLAMKRWIKNAEIQCNNVLKENWDCVEKLAQALLEKETLYGSEFDSLLEKKSEKNPSKKV